MSAYWLGNKEHLKFVFGEHLGFFKYIFVNILLRSSGPFALRDVYRVLLGAQLHPSSLTQLLSTPLLPLYSTALFFLSGHSMGGATTIRTLSQDKRFKGGVALDSWMFPVR